MFNEGLPLAQRVPSWLSGQVRLFAGGGLATLRVIRQIDFDRLLTGLAVVFVEWHRDSPASGGLVQAAPTWPTRSVPGVVP